MENLVCGLQMMRSPGAAGVVLAGQAVMTGWAVRRGLQAGDLSADPVGQERGAGDPMGAVLRPVPWCSEEPVRSCWPRCRDGGGALAGTGPDRAPPVPDPARRQGV